MRMSLAILLVLKLQARTKQNGQDTEAKDGTKKQIPKMSVSPRRNSSFCKSIENTKMKQISDFLIFSILQCVFIDFERLGLPFFSGYPRFLTNVLHGLLIFHKNVRTTPQGRPTMSRQGFSGPGSRERADPTGEVGGAPTPPRVGGLGQGLVGTKTGTLHSTRPEARRPRRILGYQWAVRD